MRRWVKTGCVGTLAVIAAVAVAATGFVYVQAQRTSSAEAEYVALGSSFAAGAGLGELQEGSPLMCARSVNGYPQRLARKLNLSIVDMACGGAMTKHLLHGGQFFQGPQVRVIGPQTKLVTITVGGNDVGYGRDLGMLASRNTGSAFGWFAWQFWSGPAKLEERDFPQLRRQMTRLVQAIRKRAPRAQIVVATYPTLLPPSGTCATLALSEAEADMMRTVGDRLAAATEAAAQKSGAIFVDMHAVGSEHSSCSREPWVTGWTNGGIAPFHPTAKGAEATANAIAKALSDSPAGVSAVR